ncbi:hypothetical protein H6G83_31290 [Anabaena azotica FACHB-119]|uniref:Uncharacterized protein n=2 Tax=Anabaena azotica TaxID=197653 RepID=A0ABR8DDJ7_9NOST|nr:hypothetical protein [Anabaena azotica FACHB-119]
MHDAPNLNKISPEFAARLTNLEPQHKVRLIVLLQIKNIEDLANKRQTRSDRQAAIKAIQDSASESFNRILGIIDKFDGKKLRDKPDLLGSIPIEIEVAGVNALTASDAVKAVMEDQSIYPAYRQNSFPSTPAPSRQS